MGSSSSANKGDGLVCRSRVARIRCKKHAGSIRKGLLSVDRDWVHITYVQWRQGQSFIVHQHIPTTCDVIKDLISISAGSATDVQRDKV